MKAIDFTQPGGFPLTQDQLGYLQEAYTESAKALAAMGGDSSTPFVISGMTIASPGPGDYNITGGWFFYNNEMVRFTASGVTGATGGLSAYIVISDTAGVLTYNDGSAPNVILDKSAIIQALPTGTPTDASHFLLSALRPFGTSFGAANREALWNTLAVSTAAGVGGVTGTVYYKKDFTANTLHIRGLLTANNAQNFTASPGALFSLMATLPAGYIPNNNAYFTGHYFLSFMIKDDLGVGWLKQVNCGVNTVGQLFVNWIKPDITIPSYGINFNTTIPLD